MSHTERDILMRVMMMNTDTMTIRQMCDAYDVTPRTLRFYEEQGLVRAERNAAGHRRFRRASIRRLSFVLIAQRLGYRLDDEVSTPAD